ncbi:hypothetical protein [Mycobacteroides chelonae]|uniref:hypothetical protein n=1 Tax=Mycobacteroides chelonae TaxID=1774 RepID=UPI0018B0D341|nr:hypothetical protein [Mycobacteroides chelonae]MBF9519506.1 hypothetical protein [Mycobacteroides chelonae]
MAFRRVTEEFAAERAENTAIHAAEIRKIHAAAVADLLALAENPKDANTGLAAVAKWRAGQEQRDVYWRFAAVLQILSGDRPDDVCSGLGIGRTALQHAIRAEDSKLAAFSEFLWRPRPKTKKKVA